MYNFKLNYKIHNKREKLFLKKLVNTQNENDLKYTKYVFFILVCLKRNVFKFIFNLFQLTTYNFLHCN